MTYFWGISMTTFASCQGFPRIGFFSTAGSSIIHWILAYYLAVDLDMKMLGVAIASSVQFFMRFLISFVFCFANPKLRRSMISLTNAESWKNLGDMFTIGFNSFLLRVMGWWAFDVFTQMAAALTETDVATQTILRNIGLFTYMIPVGLSGAVNFYTGKYIGKNRVDLAKRISNLCMTVTFGWSFVSMAVVWFGMKPIMNFYTKDESVHQVAYQAWYVLTLFTFFDCMQGVSAGNISGLNLMAKVKWVTTINYWVIGIPVALYLMFKLDMGIEGLWYGPTLACAFNYFIYEYVIKSADWHEIAAQVAKKMAAETNREE